MMKNKVKAKGQGKDAGAALPAKKAVKPKGGKPKTSLTAKLPPVGEWWRAAVQFVVEAWQELKKVAWPTRKETLGTTAMVIILVIIISAFLGLVDMALSGLVKRIIK
jgi:preprotein translocase subunit SecE